MNILVLDDHPLVRKGIVDILSINNPGIQIDEADNIGDAIRILGKKTIGIALVDIFLGRENGFDFIEQAKDMKNGPDKYIILTSSSNLADFKKAEEFEVEGYILKDAFIEEILCAFQVIQRGGRFFSSSILARTIHAGETDELANLTKREKEVLVLLEKGYSNAHISEELFISEGTTKKHISSILAKLNLASRIEAILLMEKLHGR